MIAIYLGVYTFVSVISFNLFYVSVCFRYEVNFLYLPFEWFKKLFKVV
jgi:hypothetical protein